MRSGNLKTFAARNREQWRRWLATHHDSESSVWLVFPRRHTGRESISYDDALDEALCFGWIDSLIRRLDDDRYARKFTPRNPGSRWSTANRERWARLKTAGRLTPAGLERAPTGRSGDAPKPSLSKVPRFIQEALRKDPAAREHFESLAPSYRRMYLGWIESARRPETKMRRLREAVGLLRAGRKLGMR